MAHVELIVGPAGAGKTARVLAEYRRELDAARAEERFGTAVWITPTGRSRAQTLRSLLADGGPVCFEPRVLTFDEFAERLLRSAPATVRPLSRTAKRKLLRDLIDDLARKRKLKHFGPVADTAGFLELCVAFISELKREEVWPEDFSRVCAQAGDGEEVSGRRVSHRDRELAAIYDAYQSRLHAADGDGLYDGEGRFWSARTLMRRGHRGPFSDVRLAVVDGFTDFTRTQYEMLAELAGWAERLLLTLPRDAAGRRADLFSKSDEAARVFLHEVKPRHEVEPRHEVRLTTLSLPAEFAATPFGHLSTNLFENPRELPRRFDADGLRVLACVRRAGEVEAIAREVKRRLVAGTPPDEIVVAFRGLDAIADDVRQTFAASGIPFACEAGRPIARSGAVRLLRSLLELEREDWTFARLTGVLRSTLFRPDWEGIADGIAAAHVAAALRELNVDAGRQTMLAAVARRAEFVEGRGRIDWLGVATTLRRLDETLRPLRAPETFAGWVDRLLAIAGDCGIRPSEHDELPGDGERVVAKIEAAGWLAFVRLVEEAKKAETLAGGPARKLPLDGFRRQLDELLADQTWDAEEPAFGCVRVLAAEQVRNLDVPHLFLGGLDESGFPAKSGEDCLFGDAERHRLSEQGLPLGHRARRSREEMLLFYGVVTRARRSLTLTYPEINDDGQTLYRSPYLQAIVDAFADGALPVEAVGRLDPVPQDEVECVTAAELRAVATRDALAGRAGLFAAMAGRKVWTDAAENLAAAAEMAAARFATTGLTNYEGVLSDPRNVKRLRRKYGGRHQFSVTELEAYAANPFRFFLANLLGLGPLTDPGPATDQRRRGSVLHAALASLHRQSGGTATAAELTESLMQRIEDQLRGPGVDSPLHRALHKIERTLLAERAAKFLAQWDDYLAAFGGSWEGPPDRILPEVCFGDAPREPDDEARPFPPAEFGPEGDRVLVRGRIDRIDVGRSDGRAVFNVIDYKLTDRAGFRPDDVAAGTNLQLAVYASAARQVGAVEAELSQVGYWGLHGQGFRPGLRDGSRKVAPLAAETVAALEEDVHRVLPRLAANIRVGMFPVVTDDPGEAFAPEYAAVARVGSLRAVADALEKFPPPLEEV